MLTLGYEEFIAPMVRAIQEQQAQIAAQQETIATLLADVSALKASRQP